MNELVISLVTTQGFDCQFCRDIYPMRNGFEITLKTLAGRKTDVMVKLGQTQPIPEFSKSFNRKYRAPMLHYVVHNECWRSSGR